MDAIFNIMCVLGALAFFLYGMKVMSNGLEITAVSGIRKFLFRFTGDKFRSISSGFLTTALMQSSSAVSVLLIGIVNARMINIRRAFSFIIGANIGTTLTLWLVLLGIAWKLETLVLPLLAIALPLYLSSKKNQKGFGAVLIGFCVIFIALGFIKDLLPSAVEFYDFFRLQNKINPIYGLWFALIGFFITAVVQSSSASTVLIALLVLQGLPLELGMSMIMGANVGTTLTAHLASLFASREAKLVSFYHTFFNVVGCLLFFAFIPWVSTLFKQWIPNQGQYQIAAFHTLFNVFTGLVLTPFVTHSYFFVKRNFIKDTEAIKKNSPSFRQGSSLAVEIFKSEIKNEVIRFLGNTRQSIALMGRLITESDEEKFDTLLSRIKELEKEGDEIEAKNKEFIQRIENYEMSTTNAKSIFTNLNIIEMLESIGDIIVKTGHVHHDRRLTKSFITPKMRTYILELQDKLAMALTILSQNISSTDRHVNMKAAYAIERQINSLYAEGLSAMENSLVKEKITPKSALFYKDLLFSYEIIADQIFRINNILQSLDQIPEKK